MGSRNWLYYVNKLFVITTPLIGQDARLEIAQLRDALFLHFPTAHAGERMKICSIKCKSEPPEGFSLTAQGRDHRIDERPFYIKNNNFPRQSHVTKSISGIAGGHPLQSG